MNKTVHENKILGVGASGGTAKGKARIIVDPDKIWKIKKGEILVTEKTNPAFTPAIMKASAIITDVGGYLSHAAIVAREMGKPCVVDTQDATEQLSNGEEIRVNGDKGEVTRY